MEEERPSLETEQISYTATEEPTPNVDNNSGKSSKLIFAVIGIIAIILVVVGLFLPPISLADRLGWGGEAAEATAVADEATTTPTEEPVANNPAIPGEFEVMAEGTAVNVTAVSPAAMAGANIGALPASVMALGNLYSVSAPERAFGEVAVTLPAGAVARTADLYGWDGTAWHFVASEVHTNQIASQPGNLFAAYALVQPGTPADYVLSADVGPQAELAPEILEQLDAVNAGLLLLQGNGDVEGEVAAVPEGDYERYLHVTNSGVVVDTASLATFLGDSAAQSNQIDTLVNTAVSNNYNGVNLDYQGVEPAQKEAFTSFASSLAAALHAQGLKLIITLGTPQEANGGWNSGGQDWAALGAIADEVQVQMPLDPLAYGEGGPAQQLLDYAVRQIDRTKLVMLHSANAVSRVGQSIVEISNESALVNFGTFEQAEEVVEVEPGTAVEIALTGEATPLEWDGVSQTYRFSYEGDANQTYQVWLGNPAALGHRLELGEGYNLRGAAVRGLDTIHNPTAYLAALAALGPDAPPQTEGAAIVWRVSDENESVLASESGNALTFAWPGHETPGVYIVTAEFALGEAIIPLDALTVSVAEPTAEEPEAETAEIEGTATPAAGGTATYDPGDADGVAKILANVRTGPGLQYGTLTGGAPAGTKVNITGRNETADWFQVVLPDNRQGWMYIQVLELNESLDVQALEVVEVPEPVAGDPGSGGSGPPPPVSAPPVAAGNFELGGQTHSFANPIVMSSAGMNWVKFQHKWGPGDSPSAVAGRIAAAHAAGFKVLLSIPGANTYPDSIDFNSYVEFLRGVAALGPDAIEVWNETNIDFEWPEGQIDPASYVNNMLAPAYNAIKSANGNVMVISGAPAPTGFDNGTNAWSDSRYMAGFFAAGGGNYADCIGAHYNSGASTPTQNSGHPTGSAHYSWYLVPTLNVYAQGGKPVCFTELGYLSGEDYGGVPQRFSWAANTTIGQHAAWLAEAVSVAANTGKVRMVIVFNVDFTHWGDDPQAGYAIIRKDGSCPACSTLASVMGR
jgi:hypothetical protein